MADNPLHKYLEHLGQIASREYTSQIKLNKATNTLARFKRNLDYSLGASYGSIPYISSGELGQHESIDLSIRYKPDHLVALWSVFTPDTLHTASSEENLLDITSELYGNLKNADIERIRKQIRPPEPMPYERDESFTLSIHLESEEDQLDIKALGTPKPRRSYIAIDNERMHQEMLDAIEFLSKKNFISQLAPVESLIRKKTMTIPRIYWKAFDLAEAGDIPPLVLVRKTEYAPKDDPRVSIPPRQDEKGAMQFNTGAITVKSMDPKTATYRLRDNTTGEILPGVFSHPIYDPNIGMKEIFDHFGDYISRRVFQKSKTQIEKEGEDGGPQVQEQIQTKIVDHIKKNFHMYRREVAHKLSRPHRHKEDRLYPVESRLEVVDLKDIDKPGIPVDSQAEILKLMALRGCSMIWSNLEEPYSVIETPQKTIRYEGLRLDDKINLGFMKQDKHAISGIDSFYEPSERKGNEVFVFNEEFSLLSKKDQLAKVNEFLRLFFVMKGYNASKVIDVDKNLEEKVKELREIRDRYKNEHDEHARDLATYNIGLDSQQIIKMDEYVQLFDTVAETVLDEYLKVRKNPHRILLDSAIDTSKRLMDLEISPNTPEGLGKLGIYSVKLHEEILENNTGNALRYIEEIARTLSESFGSIDGLLGEYHMEMVQGIDTIALDYTSTIQDIDVTFDFDVRDIPQENAFASRLGNFLYRLESLYDRKQDAPHTIVLQPLEREVNSVVRSIEHMESELHPYVQELRLAIQNDDVAAVYKNVALIHEQMGIDTTDLDTRIQLQYRAEQFGLRAQKLGGTQ